MPRRLTHLPLVLMLLLAACSSSSGTSDPASGGTRGMGGASGAGGSSGAGGTDPNDMTPPSVGIETPPSGDGDAYVVGGTASDNAELRELSYRVNGGDPQPLVVIDGRFAGFATLEEGDNTIEVIAVDAGGNETIDTITVSYTADPNEPEEPDFNEPSSLALIDEALANGDIDEETALLYRLYASFDSDRLPENLRADGYIDAGALLRQVRPQLDSLSPGAREVAESFFIPPIYEGTWYDDAGEPGALAKARKGQPVDCEAETDPLWRYAEYDKLRVWWSSLRPAHDSIARAVLNELATKVWPKLTALTGKAPPVDLFEQSIKNHGCTDHYDVYIEEVRPNSKGKLPHLAYVTEHDGASGCDPWPSYMVVAGNKSLKSQRRLYSMAHELMHSFQFAYRSCLEGDSVRWLVESTANWAIDHVYPNAVDPKYAPDHFEHAYAQQTYLNSPDKPIYLVDGEHEYGAYLWPFYFTKVYGDSLVPEIFEGIGKTTNLRTVLATIDGLLPGGFHEEFAEFTLLAYNDEAVWAARDGFNFKEWDSMKVSPANAKPAKGLTEVSAHLDGGKDRHILMTLGVEPLAAKMVHIKFDDPSVHSAMFSNGFTFDLKNGTLPGIPTPSATDYAQRLGDEDKKGRRVWALVKQDGAWLDEPFDLSDVAFVSICQDVADESVEEMVLIFTNANWESESSALPKGIGPRLFVSNVGCGPWVGDGRFDVMVNEPNHQETSFANFTNIEFTRPQLDIREALRGAGDFEFNGNIVSFTNFASVGFGASYELSAATINWQVNRIKTGSMQTCIANGSGAFNESNQLAPALFIVSPYLTASLAPGSLYRSYQVQLAIGSTGPVVTDSCSGPEPFSVFLSGGLRDTPGGDFQVSADGQSIDAEWASDEASFELHLEASSSF